MHRTGERARVRADGQIERLSHVPAPASGHTPPAPAGTAGAVPRTARQEILCLIFAELLGVASVGPHDDFFALGGQSLLAARVVSRIRKVFGADMNLDAVFRAPTVARLDAWMDHAGQARPRPASVPRPGRLPVAPAQLRLWMLDQIQGPNPSYNVGVALRLRGAVDSEALEAAVNDTVAHHEALRTVFPDADGEPYQYVLHEESARVVLERADCAHPALDGLLADCLGHAFDLADGPLLRAHLVSLDDTSCVLLLVVHHIVCDGRSVPVLLRDLGAAYRARLDGCPPELAPEAGRLQYADYVLWERDVFGDAERDGSPLAEQLRHWRDTLAALPPEATLPPDRARSERADQGNAFVPVALGAESHRALLRLARESGTTLFMALHAAFAAALTVRGAGTDLPIGTPVDTRTDERLDDVVGFFVNNLVLRTDVSGDPDFRALLGRVRATDLEAYQHRQLPFDRIVRELNPPRSLTRNPLFQIGLALEQEAPSSFTAPGLEVDPLPLRAAAAKSDLDLTLMERLDACGDPAGITGALEYLTALYDRVTVEALAGCFERLVTALTDDPDAPLSVVARRAEAEQVVPARP
ncbi:condensation domain-containing protein [Streptomyces sp. rh34]|uniref:condensation domain-containing protein n=1 Tax=Streptomyces sp. rh34 TaxID=2034272 RepID=UPI00211D3129|nr:condensation domain-containing protein [Streptomyces sp. rh34]